MPPAVLCQPLQCLVSVSLCLLPQVLKCPFNWVPFDLLRKTYHYTNMLCFSALIHKKHWGIVGKNKPLSVQQDCVIFQSWCNTVVSSMLQNRILGFVCLVIFCPVAHLDHKLNVSLLIRGEREFCIFQITVQWTSFKSFEWHMCFHEVKMDPLLCSDSAVMAPLQCTLLVLHMIFRQRQKLFLSTITQPFALRAALVLSLTEEFAVDPKVCVKRRWHPTGYKSFHKKQRLQGLPVQATPSAHMSLSALNSYFSCYAQNCFKVS